MKRRETPAPQGEWTVEETDDGFAVLDAKGQWAASFADKERACLSAAIWPQLLRGLRYRLVRRDDASGYDVVHETPPAVGRIREYQPELIEALHVTEGIVRSPEALARLQEAASPEVLEAARRRSRS